MYIQKYLLSIIIVCLINLRNWVHIMSLEVLHNYPHCVKADSLSWTCTAETTLLSFEVLVHDMYNNQTGLKYKNQKKNPSDLGFSCLPDEFRLPICMFTYRWQSTTPDKILHRGLLPSSVTSCSCETPGVGQALQGLCIRLPLRRLLPSPLQRNSTLDCWNICSALLKWNPWRLFVQGVFAQEFTVRTWHKPWQSYPAAGDLQFCLLL